MADETREGVMIPVSWGLVGIVRILIFTLNDEKLVEGNYII